MPTRTNLHDGVVEAVALRLLKYFREMMTQRQGKRFVDLLISGGLGLVLSALIAVGYIAYESTAHLIESNQHVTNTHRVVENLTLLRLELQNAEAGAERRAHERSRAHPASASQQLPVGIAMPRPHPHRSTLHRV